MRILMITPAFPPQVGGAENGAFQLARRLAANHSVTVLTETHRKTASSDNRFEEGFTLLRYSDFLNLGRFRGRMLTRGALPPFSIGASLAAIRTMRELHPDLVNVHYAAYTGMAALWAQNAARIPTVLSLVGRDATPGPGTPRLWPWYAKQLAKHVRHVVTLSEFSRACYEDDAIQSSTIPYGVDTNLFSPWEPFTSIRYALGIKPETRVLFSLQRLESMKHVEVAIEALGWLMKSGMENLVLLIGGTGQEGNRLRQLVKKKGLGDHVRFLGFVPQEELPGYYALADVFVFPSTFETFGIVLVEAMAAGIPVVAARAGAIPEIVVDGETGFLVQPLSPESMAVRLRSLLENDSLRQGMGQAGRDRAVKCYDWDKLVADYEELFQHCLENPVERR